MPGPNIAATGTRVSRSPSAREPCPDPQPATFLQNSLSTRFRVAGFTFQSIARKVRDRLDMAIVRGVKAMVKYAARC